MVQALSRQITFEEFLEWKPESGRYELHNGVIIEMQPTGEHERVKGFLIRKITVEFDKLNLPYFIPNQALVKIPSKETSYLPDILILNDAALASEPLWNKFSTVQKGASIPLFVEVVSTNWRDDYFAKFGDYEEIGVPEYWIVDYAALSGRRFIGNPKQPTISVYQLVDDEYQVIQFRGADFILSSTFPSLSLTAEQVFQAAFITQQ